MTRYDLGNGSCQWSVVSGQYFGLANSTDN